jgi:two-component system LytT family response regulator
MPDMDGFDVADALLSIPETERPQIVFVTAHDRHAVRAFEINAIDYVLKPYTVERIRKAVDRVRERQVYRANRTDEESGLKHVVSNSSNRQGQTMSDRYATRLVFKSRGRILFLPIDEIRWIESEENYVRICTGSESHLLRETIVHLESRLDPNSFLRVHRSTIVNLHYVKEVRNEPGGDASVVLTSGDKIAMGRSYKARIQKLLKG